MTDKRDVETMAQRWQRQKPDTSKNWQDFMLRLCRIDSNCKFKLVDNDTAVEIVFSDGSSYRTDPPTIG